MVTITLQARPRPLAAATAPRSERGRTGHAGVDSGVAAGLARRSGGALPHVPGGALPWAMDAQRRRESIERSFAAASASFLWPAPLVAALRWFATAIDSLRVLAQQAWGVGR